MEKQNFQKYDDEVIAKFIDFRKKNPRIDQEINLSWSNWGFGMEPFEKSIKRLSDNNIHFIELHGNRYGKDLGYKTNETRKILDDYGIKVSGICGMVSPECELSSNKPHITQRSIDYFRRQIELCVELKGEYILFAPGAVGRPKKYDDNEFLRAADAIRIIGDDFQKAGIRAAIEPVRSAEVSFCHTFADAKKLIDAVNHPGVQYIAGDVYHMLAEEEHIGNTIMDYGHMMTNLHMADSHRQALGTGCLDLDIILMALYLVNYNNSKCFCSPEPLGPGGDPYPQMWGTPDEKLLDNLVSQTASYFYKRNKEILNADPESLKR
jgi:D-psicose/D-tagatose/L-ribulose 3-epimerase